MPPKKKIKPIAGQQTIWILVIYFGAIYVAGCTQTLHWEPLTEQIRWAEQSTAATSRDFSE